MEISTSNFSSNFSADSSRPIYMASIIEGDISYCPTINQAKSLKDIFAVAALFPVIGDALRTFNEEGEGFAFDDLGPDAAQYDRSTEEVYLSEKFTAIDLIHEVRHFIQYRDWGGFFDGFGDLLETHPQFFMLAQHATEADAYSFDALFGLLYMAHRGSIGFDADDYAQADIMIGSIAQSYAYSDKSMADIKELVQPLLSLCHDDADLNAVMALGFLSYYKTPPLMEKYLKTGLSNLKTETPAQDLFALQPDELEVIKRQFALVPFQSAPYIFGRSILDVKRLFDQDFGGLGDMQDPETASALFTAIAVCDTPKNRTDLKARYEELYSFIYNALKDREPSSDYQKIMMQNQSMVLDPVGTVPSGGFLSEFLCVDDRKRNIKGPFLG